MNQLSGKRPEPHANAVLTWKLAQGQWKSLGFMIFASFLLALAVALTEHSINTIIHGAFPGMETWGDMWTRLAAIDLGIAFTSIGTICALLLPLYLRWTSSNETQDSPQHDLATQEVREDVILLLALSAASSGWLIAPAAAVSSPIFTLLLLAAIGGLSSLVALREKTAIGMELQRFRERRSRQGLMRILGIATTRDLLDSRHRSALAIRQRALAARADIRRTRWLQGGILIVVYGAVFTALSWTFWFPAMMWDVLGLSFTITLMIAAHCSYRRIRGRWWRVGLHRRFGGPPPLSARFILLMSAAAVIDIAAVVWLTAVVWSATQSPLKSAVVAIVYAAALIVVRPHPRLAWQTPYPALLQADAFNALAYLVDNGESCELPATVKP